MTKPKLIVVDDDPGMAKLVKAAGESSGFDVLITTSAREFQKTWAENTSSVIVMDIVIPEMDGVELLMWLAEQNCSAPIILISGYGGKYLEMTKTLATDKKVKIVGTLTKPFKIDDLEKMLKEALPSSDRKGLAAPL